MRRLGLVFPVVLAASFLWSCEESLPEYHDPSRILEAGMDGLYVISRTDNSMKVYLLLVSKFDETLEARAEFEGTITVVWVAGSELHKDILPRCVGPSVCPPV